ncbi:putative DNA modification/repair radical SAM protein [Desulfocurvibacter africanus]|uniref:putative DNA modification/repair radical SAM protein n=1 Tax=Desulfocurvibacter africanus TaxID=873 RepID=UPI001ED943DD|nr:putative DNA modification/repair radical SAM protein [Desulfocurvibacter africanus]
MRTCGRMELRQKLSILADAAKYDASCASSGASPRASSGSGGLGATAPLGVCHSFTPDGRCISLLKVLLTNHCVYDCSYCVNRASNDTPRTAFTPNELAGLTIEFYRRNYIEGLFLSSGISGSPDATMERMLRVVRSLRREHGFYGYIHLKVIAGCDPRLVALAGLYADRLSANVELPTEDGLRRLAPDKSLAPVYAAMGRMAEAIAESRAEPRAPRFAPGGQGTQMIVGADSGDDATILRASGGLYQSYGLKRVYYSAFMPVVPDSWLPSGPPPLVREHRLYQADWLMRFYGFGVEEILTGAREGMLDPHLDPKLAWALAHRERFPVDVNRAGRAELLRVPGLGVRSVERILDARRQRSLRSSDMSRLRVPLSRVLPFVCLADHLPRDLDDPGLRRRFLPPPVQLSLFDQPERSEHA